MTDTTIYPRATGTWWRATLANIGLFFIRLSGVRFDRDAE